MSTRLFTATAFAAASVLAGCAADTADAPEPTPVQPTAAPAPSVTAGDYAIDNSHAEVGFAVTHLGLNRVRGTFDDVEATIRIPDGQIQNMEVEATAQIASVNTRNERRDGHLQSDDFFDAANHPEMTFVSTGISNIDGNEFDLMGDLTIRGTTKPITLDAEFLGESPGMGAGRIVGFRADGEINRKDFGLTWDNLVEGVQAVSDDVEIMIEIQGVEVAEAAEEGGTEVES
jgi:polyisoprenoid-binding protein YceI